MATSVESPTKQASSQDSGGEPQLWRGGQWPSTKHPHSRYCFLRMVEMWFHEQDLVYCWFWISISHWVVKGFDFWSHLGHRFMEDNMGNYFEPESEYSRMDYCWSSCLRSQVTCTCKNNSVLSKYLFKSYKRDYLFTIKQTSTTLPMTLPNQDEARYVKKKIRMRHITFVRVFFYKRLGNISVRCNGREKPFKHLTSSLYLIAQLQRLQ